jgi:hypothetical protein
MVLFLTALADSPALWSPNGVAALSEVAVPTLEFPAGERFDQ